MKTKKFLKKALISTILPIAICVFVVEVYPAGAIISSDAATEKSMSGTVDTLDSAYIKKSAYEGVVINGILSAPAPEAQVIIVEKEVPDTRPSTPTIENTAEQPTIIYQAFAPEEAEIKEEVLGTSTMRESAQNDSYVAGYTQIKEELSQNTEQLEVLVSKIQTIDEMEDSINWFKYAVALTFILLMTGFLYLERKLAGKNAQAAKRKKSTSTKKMHGSKTKSKISRGS